jgi:hypothetical protein
MWPIRGAQPRDMLRSKACEANLIPVPSVLKPRARVSGERARHVVEAQCRADEGDLDRARELQAMAKLAQQRASTWHLRAKDAAD